MNKIKRNKSPVKWGWLIVNGLILIAGITFFVISFMLRNKPGNPSHREVVSEEPPRVLTPNPTVETNDCTLYYGSYTRKGITRVNLQIAKQPSLRNIAREILALLQTKPEDEDLFPVVAKGTSLRAVYIVDDLLVLDFSPQIRDIQIAGMTAELESIQAITRTFLETFSSGIRYVKFLVDGKEADTLKGHISLEEPFTAGFYDI